MQTIGLGNLLAPLTTDEFFKNHWPKQPLFLPPLPNKLKAFLELEPLQTPAAMVAGRSAKVRACLPDYDDEYSSIMVDPADALKVYRNNMTLVFDAMHTHSPLIAATLWQLRSDLGLVTGGGEVDLTRARAMAYATPAGGHTRLHFDANANFVIQIKGTKRWSLAPNTSVENPTERFTSCTGELDAALEKQCHAQLLEHLPDDSLEFLMEPGCVLFVPRGYWHETSTEDDSISLNFTFSQPTWADIVLRALHERLLQSGEWRELADGLQAGEEARRKSAVARFEVLLRELASALPAMSGQELLADSNLLS